MICSAKVSFDTELQLLYSIPIACTANIQLLYSFNNAQSCIIWGLFLTYKVCISAYTVVVRPKCTAYRIQIN